MSCFYSAARDLHITVPLASRRIEAEAELGCLLPRPYLGLFGSSTRNICSLLSIACCDVGSPLVAARGLSCSLFLGCGRFLRGLLIGRKTVVCTESVIIIYLVPGQVVVAESVRNAHRDGVFSLAGPHADGIGGCGVTARSLKASRPDYACPGSLRSLRLPTGENLTARHRAGT